MHPSVNQSISDALKSALGIGQEHMEESTIRSTFLGTITTQWNISMAAKIGSDRSQIWRYFGVTVRGHQFGFVVKLP